METKLSKWGNSFAVRIPSVLVKDANLYDGLEMEIERKVDKIVLSPKRSTGYNLDNLLKKVTSKNVHEESNFGSAVGQEKW